MIGELYTPPMHRDLMSAGMPMFEFDPTLMGMGSMYGMCGMGGFYNTNYLGGVRLQPNLNQDTVHILKGKEKESDNAIIKFGKVALGLFAFAVLTKMFKGKTKKMPSSHSKWYNPMTWFKKSHRP